MNKARRSRRGFFRRASHLGSGAIGLFASVQARNVQTGNPTGSTDTPPGAPPAFATAAPAGPPVDAAVFESAEKLVRVNLLKAEREQAALSWPKAMAPFYERRTGPRKVVIPADVPPYSQWNPVLPGESIASNFSRFVASQNPNRPLPQDEDALAFASVAQLGHWIKAGKLSSVRLTELYLHRLQRFDPKLKCVITLTPELALQQAQRADRELQSGHYRSPLHGIPWGAKDLLDTANIRTTYGAEPFRDRIPAEDAVVVKRLREAGAVLVAKLSLGALALNDIWFGGMTVNPWLPEEGSSGSSAGPGAATAAGLVGFSIGSETGGSIVSPSMRCGVTGLRPTFGRVPRTGAMTLCWSLDKLGPMTRYVEDALLVLQAISGPDEGDLSSVPSHLSFDADASVSGLRVGYFPHWMNEAPATEVDRNALEAVRSLGMTLVPLSLPDWPYDSLQLILFAEAAAAWEELTLSGQIRELREQTPDAWPNSFRQARFLSAVDLVQADRFRRLVAVQMANLLRQVDVLLVPSLRDEMLTITNFTGHPSLTLRAGYVQVSEARSDWAPNPDRPLPRFDKPRRVPHGVTLIGRLFAEGTIGQVGLALERSFRVAADKPPGFSYREAK